MSGAPCNSSLTYLCLCPSLSPPALPQWLGNDVLRRPQILPETEWKTLFNYFKWEKKTPVKTKGKLRGGVLPGRRTWIRDFPLQSKAISFLQELCWCSWKFPIKRRLLCYTGPPSFRENIRKTSSIGVFKSWIPCYIDNSWFVANFIDL